MQTELLRRHVQPGEVAAGVLIVAAAVFGIGSELSGCIPDRGPEADGVRAGLQYVYWLAIAGVVIAAGVWLARLRERTLLELDFDEGVFRVRQQGPLRKPSERLHPWDDASAITVSHPEGDDPLAAIVLHHGNDEVAELCRVPRAEAKSIVDRFNAAILRARHERDERELRAEVRARTRKRRPGSKRRA
jgi:hypothetical protein